MDGESFWFPLQALRPMSASGGTVALPVLPMHGGSSTLGGGAAEAPTGPPRVGERVRILADETRVRALQGPSPSPSQRGAVRGSESVAGWLADGSSCCCGDCAAAVGHGGWNPMMSAHLGQVGTISEVARADVVRVT